MRAAGVSSWIAVGLVACGCVTVVPEPAPAAEPARGVLASGRPPNSSGTHRDEGYSWLGEYEVRVTIDVPPRAGHVLAFRWGAKNDTRTGSLAVNGGKARVLSGGGYDGFRWLRVEVGDKVAGKRYELVLKPGRKYEELAKNNLETFRASLVFKGSRMYVRGYKSLWCIGK